MEHSDAVIPWRADGDFVTDCVFTNDGKERAPKNDKAGSEQDQVVEQEHGLAG